MGTIKKGILGGFSGKSGLRSWSKLEEYRLHQKSSGKPLEIQGHRLRWTRGVSLQQLLNS